MKKVILLLFVLCNGYFAVSQIVAEPSTEKHPEWSAPYEPFQIAGNLYYVGTYDLACFLLVTPKGNILINTGLASSRPMIKASIKKLGFKVSDTKILLTTQAHFDHLGAMAALKKETGAKMMIDAGDAGVLQDGGRSDYAMGSDTSFFAPVKADRLLHNGDTISLGGMHLVMLHHPGHTKGSCSFIFDVKDGTETYRVLIANLPTIVTEKKFSEIPAYPTIAEDYTYTLNSLKNLNFDIWLASHASQFDLYGKHKSGSAYNPQAFMDKKGYDAQIEELQKELTRKIEGK